MQKLALKNLKKSKDGLENSNNNNDQNAQILCFEEGTKGILFKDNEIEIKLIYRKIIEIVKYKIIIQSVEGIFILNSCELILNTGKGILIT